MRASSVRDTNQAVAADRCGERSVRSGVRPRPRAGRGLRDMSRTRVGSERRRLRTGRTSDHAPMRSSSQAVCIRARRAWRAAARTSHGAACSAGGRPLPGSAAVNEALGGERRSQGLELADRDLPARRRTPSGARPVSRASRGRSAGAPMLERRSGSARRSCSYADSSRRPPRRGAGDEVGGAGHRRTRGPTIAFGRRWRTPTSSPHSVSTSVEGSSMRRPPNAFAPPSRGRRRARPRSGPTTGPTSRPHDAQHRWADVAPELVGW